MSVESEILRIQHNVADAYAKVSEKGGEVPLQPNSGNLPAAIASIPGGQAGVNVESYNTEDGWYVRKWSDGYAEMIYKGSNPSPGSFESPYTYYIVQLQTLLPIALVDKYSENLSLLTCTNTGNPKLPVLYNTGDNEKTGRWGVVIMAKATGVTMTFSLVVTGRWK